MPNGMILTKKGREVLALALAGQELHFTRGAIGDGDAPDNPEDLNGLVQEQLSLAIEKFTTNKTGTCEVVMNVSNMEREHGLWLREYGLFVTHPETQEEVLYAYCHKGTEAGYLEGYDGYNPVGFKLRLITVIDQAGNITVVLDATSIERLNERISIVEAALSGLTPPMVVDRIRDLELSLAWNPDDDAYDYTKLTPEEVAAKLHKLHIQLTWDEEDPASILVFDGE